MIIDGNHGHRVQIDLGNIDVQVTFHTPAPVGVSFGILIAAELRDALTTILESPQGQRLLREARERNNPK